MIYGIGTDIVDQNRIQRSFQRFQDRFVQRILNQKELEYFKKSNNPINFLAKRFAAKEAFSKSVHTGLLFPVIFSNIIIEKTNAGRPFFKFEPELQGWLSDLGIRYSHLSFSDDNNLVIAFVITEK